MKKYILNSILLCTILKIEIRLTQACADQNGVGGPNPLEISYLLNSRSIITKSIPWTSLENTIIHWTPTPRKIAGELSWIMDKEWGRRGQPQRTTP